MSIIKTIVRLRKAIVRLNRLIEKGELLSIDERKEIATMAKRLDRIEASVIDRVEKVKE